MLSGPPWRVWKLCLDLNVNAFEMRRSEANSTEGSGRILSRAAVPPERSLSRVSTSARFSRTRRFFDASVNVLLCRVSLIILFGWVPPVTRRSVFGIRMVEVPGVLYAILQ